MSARVSPTDRIRGEIDALFDGSRELSEVIEDVARLGARLIIQTAVEAEVDVFLGRARYQRAAECPDARAGSRNGFCESTIKTTAGPVTVARPKLRGTTEAFASQLFGKSVTKSQRVGVAGDRRVRARPVGARCGEHSGRRARRRGGAVQVDGLAGVPGDRRRVHAVVVAAPGRAWSWTTCSWTRRCSRCTPVPAPSRCWPRGASPPKARRCSSRLAAGGSESTDAWGDFLDELPAAGCARRCWSSATAPPG